MTTEWAFLGPWYAALCASFIQNPPTYPRSEMQVSFKWPLAYVYPHRKCSLVIHLKEGDPQNVIQLKMIQEAMELFTILSVVNNNAFTERFSQLTQSTDKSERRYCPGWNLYVSGDAAVQQDTWSSFFEVLDPSPQFQRAIRMLKAKELGDTEKGNSLSCNGVQWTCKFDGAEVRATLIHDKETDTMNGIKLGLRTLFNAGVPLIIQLGLYPNNATQGDIWQDLRQQVPVQVNIFIALRDLTTEYSRGLAAGLTRTPIHSLTIMFDNESKTNDAQATINAGILMNRAYDWYRVVSDDDKQFICKKVSKSVFAAICSTIAAQSQTSISFSVGSVDSESWPRLLNAIWCGTPTEVTIWNATLTKSDLLGIADVLRYNFPHSTSAALKLQSRSHCAASRFGFVDILKGTTVWRVEERGAPAFVTPSSIRCRAWFKEDSTVEVVIPGFGRCQSRIGDGVYEVSRDSQVSGTLRKLYVFFTAIESVSLVVNLLELIGRNLRSLTLYIPSHSNDLPLDLSVLSGLCPNLEFLEIRRFDVVVSVHNEALCLWPIKWLRIKDSEKLADITLCLRNPSLRMTRELEKLDLECCNQEYDEQEKRDLMTHNGDFLAITKEKFPIQSKAALISVIDGAHCEKAIHRLHEDVVGLIFAFASMPAQRSVGFWPRRR